MARRAGHRAHPARGRADILHEVIAHSGARTRVELHAPAEFVEPKGPSPG